MTRTISWFSCGAASAVATKLILQEGPATIAYCDTGSEHPDNARFRADCEKWFGQKVEILRAEKYKDTWDVWEKRKFLAGPEGAPCTGILKVGPRLEFQRPDDIHVYGFTNDKSDVNRAKRIRENNFDMTIRTPLIERGLDKAACLALIQGAGIKEPVTYAMGFPNANCMPCVKATSPDYWSLYRREFPEGFARMVELSRRLGARLTRINDERIFIDEIPEDWPVTQPLVPACDLLCGSAADELR